MKPRIPKRLTRDLPDGFPKPYPTTNWRCFLFGCDVPKCVTSDYWNVTPDPRPSGVTMQTYDRSGALVAVEENVGSWGVCGPVPCKRCGRRVKPFDRDYPFILPDG
jgi:hypothetical protein